MADSVEALENIAHRLYENILGPDAKDLLEGVSLETKEKIVKDKFLDQTSSLFKALNNEFKDVRFTYQWSSDAKATYTSYLDCKFNDFLKRDYYDCDITDLDHLEELDQPDKASDSFYEIPLNQIDVKISYYWERKCSLGCLHTRKRFYFTNLVKMLDMVTYYKIGMPIRTIVKQFIPDFFYDPTEQKRPRGRPRSSSNSDKLAK